MIAWVQAYMDEKANGGYNSATTTFTDVWMQQEEKMSQEDIFLGIAPCVGGGSDTTYGGIVNVIHCLVMHPEVAEKLQFEIDELVRAEGLEEYLISYKTARRLPYLQAVIKESMRITPIVGVQLPRRVPKGGENLAGYFFREGLTVGVNPWTTRTNVKYFGDDADVFRPERWLGEGEEAKRNEHYHIPV